MSTYAQSLISQFGEAAKIAVPLAILGFFCLVWICLKLLKSKRKPNKSLDRRSTTFRELYGGDIAMKRLFENHEGGPSTATLDRTDSVIMKGLLDNEHLELKKLQVHFLINSHV